MIHLGANSDSGGRPPVDRIERISQMGILFPVPEHANVVWVEL